MDEQTTAADSVSFAGLPVLDLDELKGGGEESALYPALRRILAETQPAAPVSGFQAMIRRSPVSEQ